MNQKIYPYTRGIVREVTALDGVTATTTSDPISVVGAKKLTLLMTRANHSSGSSAFSVTGSVDGTTFVTLNKLITNVTNTNAQTKIRAASVTLSANGSELAGIDIEDMGLHSIKVTVTETTDGTHSAKVLIEK